MKLQIDRILLASHNGDVRRLVFKRGQVNVITGGSNTGKSSIISLVEYCLGRSDFTIPEGVISDNVSWYAVVYQMRDQQILIAKPAPKEGKQSQSEAYLKAARKVDDPDFANLVPNTTDDAVVEYLTRALGVTANMTEVPEGDTRQAHEANLKHTRYYLFQDQGTVANDKILFHRQAEQFMPQAIRDTLPYFLGVYDDERIRTIDELRRARRDLKLADQRLHDAEAMSSRSGEGAWGLLAEARETGLLADGALGTLDAALDALRGLLKWVPTTPPALASDKTQALRSVLREKRLEIERLNSQIHAAETFAREGTAFAREAATQRSRLTSIGLFEDVKDDSTCPLCSSRPKHRPPAMVEIAASLKRLDSDLSAVERETPQVTKYLETLREQRDATVGDVQRSEAMLEAATREHAESARIADRNARAARVVGRVSLFLESLQASAPDQTLANEVARARKRVASLESALAADDEAEALSSALSWISSQMTRWADVLKLEFRGQPYRFDLGRLTVIADRDGRPIPMGKRMGGGENWLGCHLICLMALHKFFIKNKRPVPSFLILDQPTQVYFPAERYRAMEGKRGELQDEDTVAVKRMYDFLFDVAKECGIQVIVLDHAYLDVPEFTHALVEEPWRKGRALVPESWYRRR